MHRSRRPPPRRPAAALALCTALALLVAACTVGPSRRPPLATAGPQAPATPTGLASSSPMPTGPGGPGRTADPIEWSACPPSVDDTAADGTRFRVDCAAVPVPVSYTDRSAGSLPIRLARARAAATPADAPPLIALLGSPGEHGRRQVATVAGSLPDAVAEHYAIIVVDLRGTGSSAGIDCLADSTLRAIVGMAADPTTSAGADQLRSITRQLTFDCGDLVGPTLTQFDSSNAADDLDTLRAALGVRTISLLGRGYGGTIAAVYANRYPGRVHRMVLDSPADPLATPGKRATASAAAAQSLLADFAAACAGFDGGCPLGDDPAGRISDLVTNLATSGEAAGHWVITGGSVLLALRNLLPEEDSWPELAAALAALADRDPHRLADLLIDALGGQRISERLSGSIIYRCNDTATRLHGDQLTDAVDAASEASALFGPFAVALAGLCGSWPAPERALGRVSAAGAPAILVLGSVTNPLHPYRGVQSLAGQLASGVLVSWQSGADGAYPRSACVRQAVDAYLLRGTVPDLGILCPP